MTYRWGIFKAGLDPVKGSEQAGTRPVMVISNEDFNQLMPVVSVIPFTARKKGRKIYITEVLIEKDILGLPKESILLIHQIRTISKDRLLEKIGFLKDEALRQRVKDSLLFYLGIVE